MNIQVTAQTGLATNVNSIMTQDYPKPSIPIDLSETSDNLNEFSDENIKVDQPIIDKTETSENFQSPTEIGLSEIAENRPVKENTEKVKMKIKINEMIENEQGQDKNLNQNKLQEVQELVQINNKNLGAQSYIENLGLITN